MSGLRYSNKHFLEGQRCSENWTGNLLLGISSGDPEQGSAELQGAWTMRSQYTHTTTVLLAQHWTREVLGESTIHVISPLCFTSHTEAPLPIVPPVSSPTPGCNPNHTTLRTAMVVSLWVSEVKGRRGENGVRRGRMA